MKTTARVEGDVFCAEATSALGDVAYGDRQHPTWAALVRREPRLAALRAEITRLRADDAPSFCTDIVWSTRFKPRLVALVGFAAERDDPMLRTTAAYALAYRTCYDELPNCCACTCA